MQESGDITALKIKWWKEKRGGGACDDAGSDSGAEELDVANVLGVYVVLISGCFFAIIVSFLEMLFDIRNRAKELDVPFIEELMNEAKFVIKCHGNVKPVRRKMSAGTLHEDESRSVSRSVVSCSPARDLSDSYGFNRPSLKNLTKLDLMADHDDSNKV